ncbi:hypothetical protein DM01DRAFT_1332937 [Hesseltinella vesiculosa]|uniref:Ubiquinol-cytochrome c chaperone domain-containing protein n=1 Tax=Hesseltinella vesiculosa TaxID=101127 RepID=A0A1X2GQR9_9FUNG|nr:hypothetical protein DM01DRAFT_1332937 [Hesseltinella vesiculosa]
MLARQFLKPVVKRSIVFARPSILATPSIICRYASTQDSEPPKKYNEATKKLVYGLARVMGYYSNSSTAIRTSHDLYNICAKQWDMNKDFYINKCQLPDNFQSWFSVTQLHVWMLMVHLRAHDQGKLHIQEIINRLFEDSEARIRDHGIKQQRMIDTYIKDLVAQFHGGVVAYDEGMCKDDPVLAAALWRNLFAPSSNNATDLAYVVQYIRRELKALEVYDGEKLMAGQVNFGQPVAAFDS